MLALLIHKLANAGCRCILINTHHLHRDMESFLNSEDFGIPVHTCYEPEILGTGGAVRNVSDFWDDQPFLVINSDIITDIDLKEAYTFHKTHEYPVTMVLHDHPEFNNVRIDSDNVITGFYRTHPLPPESSTDRLLAFTGIHVIDPEVVNQIPENSFSDIIDVYGEMIARGRRLKACIVSKRYWKDIGTPQRYREAVIDHLAPEAFERAAKKPSGHLPTESTPHHMPLVHLAGDGSDRNWYRIQNRDQSLIIADHGIGTNRPGSEFESYISIGKHLHHNQVNAPEIFLWDRFSGLVFVEDLGDTHLQTLVLQTHATESITAAYQVVIDQMIHMGLKAAQGFDPAWTWQTPTYDRFTIIEKECRYFIDAFVRGYLKMDVSAESLMDEFERLTEGVNGAALNGFMHRDFQSRNILHHNGRFYIIDFQGGRIGPIQYDLASLLIDPYVNLSEEIRQNILNYCVRQLVDMGVCVCSDTFQTGYEYCRLTRNLQILGAFGFLSRVRGKTYFEAYIPPAVHSLTWALDGFTHTPLPRLKSLIEKVAAAVPAERKA